MTSRAPAEIGMSLEEVDTPALLIDLDALERNLARMARAVEGSGARLRPHSKTHKSPVIAGRQMALGAVGVRSEEHTSELQSLMRISYAVFCLKKKKNKN